MVNKHQYAEVILGIKALDIDHPFDYEVSENLDDLDIGSVVMVPFQSRLEIGYIVRLKNHSLLKSSQLKPIHSLIASAPVFDKFRIKLIYWMSFYYLQPLASVAQLFTPPGKKPKIEKIWKAVRADRKLEQLKVNFPLSDRQLQDNPGLKEEVLRYQKQGLVTQGYRLIKPSVGFKYRQMVSLNNEGLSQFKKSSTYKRSHAQKRIIQVLQQRGKSSKEDLIKKSNSGYASLKALQDKGVVNIEEERVKRDFKYDKEDQASPDVTLNIYQKQCLQSVSSAVKANQFKAFLLEGVAGSGKTKVYIEACKQVIEKGRKALVLTPEISLTPQLFARFTQEFGEEVCVYHSNMSQAERYERWMEVAEGKNKIVVGTRSAIFLPFKDLGIIVVDEEHDPSYKENSKVRYNLGDVALKLGRILSIPVVFGSATPSVVIRYKAETESDFELLKMPEKATRSRDILKEVIDLKKVNSASQSHIITNRLHQAIKEHLDKQNKVIIFINKRGYSNFLICNSCGHVLKCPACNLALKYHITDNVLRCHHCGREFGYSPNCNQCGQKNILLKGTGIQRVERQLNLRFKPVPVLRMDSDATVGKKSHQKILNSFLKPGPAILLGTQMIAKGLDIGDVTLVGIINCDSMLELPDYHMYERTYQLISQVAGRAGRKSKQGKVIIQTYNPRHEVISSFLKQDYQSFYLQELKNRKELSYPPFSHIVNIVISGTEQQKVQAESKRFFTELSKVIKIKAILLGPSPAPFSKINRYYRWHIMIKTEEPNRLMANFNKFMKNYRKVTDTRIIIDVDPAWIL